MINSVGPSFGGKFSVLADLNQSERASLALLKGRLKGLKPEAGNIEKIGKKYIITSPSTSDDFVKTKARGFRGFKEMNSVEILFANIRKFFN